tara:strand:- start:596 stop:925 length:330 start_codon:yes stop_codon:yes gene_type:complete
MAKIIEGDVAQVSMGQHGCVFTDADGAITPPTGKAFVAITMLDDTTFDSSGGLIAENPDLYANTEAAATAGGAGGDQVDVSNTFPKGVTIYGRWTEIDMGAGMIIAYIG